MIILLHNITRCHFYWREAFTNIYYIWEDISVFRATLFDSSGVHRAQIERRAINFLLRQSFPFLFPRYVLARIRRTGKTSVGQRALHNASFRDRIRSLPRDSTGKEDRSYRGIAADVYRELKGSKGDGDVFRANGEESPTTLALCPSSLPPSFHHLFPIRFSIDHTEVVCAREYSTNGHPDIYKLLFQKVFRL